jgi:hypothetical protein
MTSATTIGETTINDEAKLVGALRQKLVDIDTHRIAPTDQLVIRKAVLGLVEIVAQLESRIIALESGAAAPPGAIPE